jgi:hypothetical protein
MTRLSIPTSVSPYWLFTRLVLTNLKLTYKTLFASKMSRMHETSGLGLLDLEQDLFVPRARPVCPSKETGKGGAPMDLGTVHMHFRTLPNVALDVATAQMRLSPRIPLR